MLLIENESLSKTKENNPYITQEESVPEGEIFREQPNITPDSIETIIIPKYNRKIDDTNNPSIQESESTNYVIGVMSDTIDYNELPDL